MALDGTVDGNPISFLRGRLRQTQSLQCPAGAVAGRMRVNVAGHADAAMAEDVCDLPNVDPVVEQRRGRRVPQRVNADPPGDARRI